MGNPGGRARANRYGGVGVHLRADGIVGSVLLHVLGSYSETSGWLRAAAPCSPPARIPRFPRIPDGAAPAAPTIPVRLGNLSSTAVGRPPGTARSVGLHGACGEPTSGGIAFPPPAHAVPYCVQIAPTGEFLPTPATETILVRGRDRSTPVRVAAVPIVRGRRLR